MPDSHSPHPEQRHVRDVPVERPLRRQPRHRGRCMRIRCSIQASSFAKDVKNVPITERPSLGGAAHEEIATPQLDFLRTGPWIQSHDFLIYLHSIL
jgi:hypothetical protein